MAPIPCSHCGTNFMKSSQDPEAPKLCNNCIVLEQRRAVPTKPKSSGIGMIIQCPLEAHAQIEEICASQGMSYTQYFMKLHDANMSCGWKLKSEVLPEITQPKEAFKGKKKKNVDG